MILGFLGATRDVLIILWALLSVVAIVFLIFAVFSIWRGIKDLIKTAKSIADDDVKPILAISQDSVANVAGTSRFLSDAVAKPAIKGLSTLAGIRRGVNVFLGLTGRRRR